MRRLFSLAIGCLALVSCAWGGATPATITVQSDGPDKYADGADVLVGELYAVVWVANGVTFRFLANGSWNVAEGCELLGLVKTQMAGCCSSWDFMPWPFQVPLSAEQMARFGSGRFELHLLDTRRLDKTLAPTEGPDEVPEATRINLATPVVSVSYADVVANQDHCIRLSEPAVAALVPEDAPRPIITSCRLDAERREFVLTVKKTVSYLDYNVSQGTTPTADDLVGGAVAPVEGVGEAEEMTIRVPLQGNEKNGFFKVIRDVPSTSKEK